MKFQKTIDNILKASNISIKVTYNKDYETFSIVFNLYVDKHSISIKKYQKGNSACPLKISTINNAISIFDYVKKNKRG